MFKPKILVLLALLIIFLITIWIADQIASGLPNDSFLPALAYLLPVGAFVGLVYWYKKTN